MKFHAWYFNWIRHDEITFLIGFSAGRVEYEPEARWLYSLRLFVGVFKFEILWTQGSPFEEQPPKGGA